MIELLLNAESALALGLLDSAERTYRTVLEADPRNGIAAVGLSRVALERGDEAGAHALARAALEIDPENATARRMIDRLEEVARFRDPGVSERVALARARRRRRLRTGSRHPRGRPRTRLLPRAPGSCGASSGGPDARPRHRRRRLRRVGLGRGARRRRPRRRRPRRPLEGPSRRRRPRGPSRGGELRGCRAPPRAPRRDARSTPSCTAPRARSSASRSRTRPSTTARTWRGASSSSRPFARPAIRRLVFSSTAAVYGTPATVPIREDAVLAPINPYGETKRAFEGALRWYADAYGLRSVSLRYFNVAGASAAQRRGP